MIAALTTLALTGAAIAGLYAIARLLLAGYRAAQRIESTYELVNHELRPNSGSSLWDAVHRIDSRVEVLEGVDRREHVRRDLDSRHGDGEHA